MARGACLCGTVRFEIEPPYRWVGHCHCSMCRKHHGALFSTSVGVDVERCRMLGGADGIEPYQATEAFTRAFCRRCGAKVPAASHRAGTMNVPAGTLEAFEDVRPRVHIFAGSRSPHVILDEVLPRFEAYPPGVDLPSVERPQRAPPAVKGGTAAGSCLCGAVAYEVAGGLLVTAHCHCSRCRRSRGSAFATIAAAPLDRLRWMRGAARVVRYALPARERRVAYVTAFCGRCGSLMPAEADRLGLALVPAGSLDTPLAPPPTVHMHVGANPLWLDVSDGLARYRGAPPPAVWPRLADVRGA